MERRARRARAGHRGAVSEAELHRAVADFLRAVIDPAQVEWTTFPAGGGGKVRGAMLKAMGLLAGWPDIQIQPRNRCLCLIELKAEGKYPTPEQRALHERLKALGCLVAVCRSVDEVEGVLSAWEIPRKGRIAAWIP